MHALERNVKAKMTASLHCHDTQATTLKGSKKSTKLKSKPVTTLHDAEADSCATLALDLLPQLVLEVRNELCLRQVYLCELFKAQKCTKVFGCADCRLRGHNLRHIALSLAHACCW